jgi:uncharacterized protein (TIGR00369 family)
MESRNPDFEKYVRYKIARNKFMKLLGYEITRIEPGVIFGEMEFAEMHEQQNGYLHGGVTATLLDMAQGFASYSLVEEGQQVFTVEAKVSYFNRGIGKKYFTEGRVVKPGKRFHFCEGEIYYLDEAGKKIIVAKGSSTMAVL